MQISLVHRRSARLPRSPHRALDESWLTTSEVAESCRWKDHRRRQQWWEGRRLAKELILDVRPDRISDPAEIEILTQNQLGASVRPRVLVRGRPLPCSLSLSHTDSAVLVAFSDTPGVSVGVDLCAPESYPASFLDTWFTPSERALVDGEGSELAARLWAIKESVYKACNSGESFAPRRIQVEMDAGKYSCTYHHRVLDDELELDCHEIHGHMAVVSTLPETLTGVCHD